MANSIPLTISYGDNPAALDAALAEMRECGAVLELEIVASGADIYRREIVEGIMPESLDSIKRTKLLLQSGTSTPKEEGYMPVMQVICEKFEVEASFEYFVGKNMPGIGIVTETESHLIGPEMVAEIYKASLAFGGRSFAYAIDELRLIFDSQQKEYPDFTAKFLRPAELQKKYADFDVIFVDEHTAKVLKKTIEPEFGCRISVGNGYAFFEPLEEYFAKGKSMLLAAAMLLKYAGQNAEAWAVYEKLGLSN